MILFLIDFDCRLVEVEDLEFLIGVWGGVGGDLWGVWYGARYYDRLV